jgi:hypothetical protein
MITTAHYHTQIQVYHESFGYGKTYSEAYFNELSVEVIRVKFYSEKRYEVPIAELVFNIGPGRR